MPTAIEITTSDGVGLRKVYTIKELAALFKIYKRGRPAMPRLPWLIDIALEEVVSGPEVEKITINERVSS